MVPLPTRSGRGKATTVTGFPTQKPARVPRSTGSWWLETYAMGSLVITVSVAWCLFLPNLLGTEGCELTRGCWATAPYPSARSNRRFLTRPASTIIAW